MGRNKFGREVLWLQDVLQSFDEIFPKVSFCPYPLLPNLWNFWEEILFGRDSEITGMSGTVWNSSAQRVGMHRLLDQKYFVAVARLSHKVPCDRNSLRMLLCVKKFREL